MESSNLNRDFLFDTLRNKWVKERPEEKIRQILLHQMIHELAFPPGLIALEKSLHSLPHLNQVQRKKIPNRRLDILVFGKNIHPHYPLFPLLLIECKAIPLSPSSIDQVVGYNDLVQAPFIALANGKRVITGHYGTEGVRFVEGLYPFNILLKSAVKK